MTHKCFISFKTEDFQFKKHIQEDPRIEIIDKSLDVAINSSDDDYIMRKIREDYLSDSTVTIHLIGAHSSESLGEYEQRFIKRELQASLYNGTGNSRNGILGVVLPNMYDRVYGQPYSCSSCGGTHSYVNVKNHTVIEFNYNYYIPNGKCAHSEEERYCVLVKWDDFLNDPSKWIDKAFQKRSNEVASKTKVYPKAYEGSY